MSHKCTDQEYLRALKDTFTYLSDTLVEIEDSGKVESDFYSDVQDGSITVYLSKGTYVISRQLPAKQIWLSSPVSGPSHYDWKHGDWVDIRRDIKLYKLLSHEFSSLLSCPVHFKLNKRF